MTGHHLVKQAAEGPPIYSSTIVFLKQDLRSHVLWRSTNRPGFFRSFLAHSKVRDLNIAVAREKNVLWLEVTVNDLSGVEVLESQEDLGCIKLCLVLSEASLPGKKPVEFSSWAILQAEVQMGLGLESVKEFNDEGVSYFSLKLILLNKVTITFRSFWTRVAWFQFFSLAFLITFIA